MRVWPGARPRPDGTGDPPARLHPDLPDLIALRGQARRLDLAPRGLVLATRAGGHLSRFRGRGMEFDESRRYQPGDDPRHMDWRVTARAGAPHVKLFREERERPVWLLVDLGPSMRFGTRVAFKSAVAAQAAALLGWAAVERGDRVGGLIFDETRRLERRPAARSSGLLPLLEGLAAGPVLAAARDGRGAGSSASAAGEGRGASPAAVAAGGGKAAGWSATAGEGAGGGPGFLAWAAARLAPLIRPGSLVVAISDFADLTAAAAAPGDPGAAPWPMRLAAAGELMLVAVWDPLEMHAPPPGIYPLTDGRRRLRLDLRDANARSRWEAHFRARRARLLELARDRRAHLLELSTADPVGPALARGLGMSMANARS